MARKIGKKYEEVKKLVDSTKLYTIDEAAKLIKQVAYSKFVSSIEVHVKTFADPKYADQMLRTTVVLPHGTGKTQKVGVFVSDDKIAEAKKAGADIAKSAQELLKDIENGKIEFDVLVTTSDMMRDLAKAAKVLGPKGLMPSPKAGTVTNDIVSTIDQIKKGRVEIKLDKTGNIHTIMGKVNFDEKQIKENFEAMFKAIEDAKPTGVKGKLVKKVVLAPTMGPGIQIQY